MNADLRLLKAVLRSWLFVLLVILIGFSAAPAQARPGLDQATVAQWLGITHPAGVNMIDYSQQIAQTVQDRFNSGQLMSGPRGPAAGGLPSDLNGAAPFSAAVLTTLGGHGSIFQQALALADVDGREDMQAAHSARLADFSSVFTNTGQMLTRIAISEHTISNGFTETISYAGDSVGNIYVIATDANNTIVKMFSMNLPTELNAFGTLQSDDQIVVTGIAVNPVSDLGAYGRVNGSYAAPFNGLVGEQVFVTFWDTGSGLRLLTANEPVRSGLLAFPVADIVSAPASPPGIVSPAGFPVQVGANFGVAFSAFGNLAGVAVDDDGNAYFQQVDLLQFTGANIVKVTSQDVPGSPSQGVAGFQDRSAATSGFSGPLTTLNPPNGNYGTSSGPSFQVNRFTNFSGTSTTFGNITALAAGPGNVLYAAVARSFVAGDDAATQATEGLFANPAALGATPSMVISFSDVSGKFELCSAPPGVITFTVPTTVVIPFTGSVPIADGFADVVQAGQTLVPGVNNFRVFVLGDGPDIRSAASALNATPDNTLKVGLQVDYTVFGGITVDEENSVYVISGGTPAGVGRNPSPNLGEILVFPDRPFADRRADYVDIRTSGQLPNPPSSGPYPNQGDGVSDRFDHIYFIAPIDPTTVAPTGLAGLARGFLLYLNRTRTRNTNFPSLPNGATQAAGASSGPFNFNDFDTSHYTETGHVAGGDLFTYGFNPALAAADGVFDFNCAGNGSACAKPISSTVFLNANGSLSFGGANTVVTPTVADLLGSAHPIIAPAWASFDTASRTSGFTNTFPVQALGFASANDFKVRWIDVPENGKEGCGSSNSFSVSLFDDGLGSTKIGSSTFNGRTDLRFTGSGGSLAGGHLRNQGSGWFYFDYGRMDLLGLPDSPVIAGYAIGGLPATLSATNLSAAARASEATNHYNPAILIPFYDARQYEFFNTAVPASQASATTVNPAVPAFDLRGEGNDPALGTPVNQPDPSRGELPFVNARAPVFMPVIER